MSGSADAATGFLNFLGQQAGSAATAFGGLLSLIGNQGRIDQSNAYLNSFYGPGGGGTAWKDFLASAANQYQPGGNLDPNVLATTLTDSANNLFSTLTPEYLNRWGRGMKYLEGAGGQERTDINTAFTNASNAAAADATSRGLSGTTVLPGVRAGFDRQRADAQGALNERIRQQYLTTDAALSGDYLRAYQDLFQNRVNSQLQAYDVNQGALNNLVQLGQAGYGVGQDDLFSRLNVIGGTSIPYPDQNRNVNLAFQGGLGSWPAPNYPRANSGSSFAQGALPGLGAGLLLGLA